MESSGLTLLLLAGFAQGTFGLGMKRYQPLSWEAFWFVYSIVGMVIIPLVCGLIISPLIFDAILSTEIGTLLTSIAVGFIWGAGGLLFGESIRSIGITLTIGIAMGLAGCLGAIIPICGLYNIIHNDSFIIILIGIVIMILGVIITVLAGLIRNKEQCIYELQSLPNIRRGIIIAITSGVLSSLMNVGFEIAYPFADSLSAVEFGGVTSSLASHIIVIFGGAILNVGFAAFLLFRNKSWRDFTKLTKKGYLLAITSAVITALLWFIPLGLTGVISVAIGDLGNIITWSAMLALSLIFGNLWGYITGEWHKARKSFLFMIIASVIFIIAYFMIGFNSFLI